MPIQRTCGAENQVRNKLSNGPLRVQSNVRNHRVFCNVRAYVSCRGYVGILIRAWFAHECKVAPRISCYIRPWQKVSFCRGRFVLIPVYQSHKPHVLAHKWFHDLGTRSQHEHKSDAKAARYANVGKDCGSAKARSNPRNQKIPKR